MVAVKVSGWRPHIMVAVVQTGAGARKPPGEDTAGGLVRWRVGRHRDIGAPLGRGDRGVFDRIRRLVAEHGIHASAYGLRIDAIALGDFKTSH